MAQSVLQDAETWYALIEGEALAMVYGHESTREYCLGNDKLTIGVDHKPLVPIMGNQNLELIKNLHLRNLKDKTLMYRFRMKHIPGTMHTGPDVASRYPGTTIPLSESLAGHGCFQSRFLPLDGRKERISHLIGCTQVLMGL